MVEKISSEQSYVNYVMNRLPNVEKGEVHTMKRGDSLWNLAKRELNKKNATNKEISDYMLLIAKLNNLDTIEKMNGLKVADKIYLPQVSEASNNTKVVSANKPQETKADLTAAENSILKLKDIILNDKTVTVEKMYKGYKSSTDLYHVYTDYTSPTGYHSRKHPVMSFTKNHNTSKITSVTFNNQDSDILSGKDDYEMDSKGNIKINNFMHPQKVGKLDNTELDQLYSKLDTLSKNCRSAY